MKTPETGAGEGGVLEGQPSTKEGAVCVFIFPGLNRNDGCIFWGGELSQVKTIICNCFRQCAFPSIVSENAQQSWETDLARGAVPTPDSARGSPPWELFFPVPLSPSPLMTVP